jgi:hypothetical protein
VTIDWNSEAKNSITERGGHGDTPASRMSFITVASASARSGRFPRAAFSAARIFISLQTVSIGVFMRIALRSGGYQLTTSIRN